MRTFRDRDSNLSNCAPLARKIRQVAHSRHRLTVPSRDLFLHFVELSAIAADQHDGAVFRHLECGRQADARGRAGDDVCFATCGIVRFVLQYLLLLDDRLNVATRYLDALRIDPAIVLRRQRRDPQTDVSGTPARPSAVPSVTLLFTAGSSRTIPPLKSVSVAPGATTLTAILHGPSSFAMCFGSISTAPFIDA